MKKNNDDFFSKTRCDRCGSPLKFRTMSWFNQDCLCPQCAKCEEKLPGFKEAKEAEERAVMEGNLNFKGVGLPESSPSKHNPDSPILPEIHVSLEESNDPSQVIIARVVIALCEAKRKDLIEEFIREAIAEDNDNLFSVVRRFVVVD